MVWLVALSLLVGLGVWAAYSRFSAKPDPSSAPTSEPVADSRPNTTRKSDEKEQADQANEPDERIADALPTEQKAKPTRRPVNPAPVQTRPDRESVTEQKPKPRITTRETNTAKATPPEPVADNPVPDAGTTSTRRYTLASRYAYFHNEPDPSTRRAANINIWNNAKLTPLDERNGFVYVVYVNEQGQTSRGWLLRKDLKLISR